MKSSRLLLLDKIGSFGAVIAAAAAPCCFPLLAVVGSALGLGVLQPYKGYAAYAIQALVLLALVGNVIAYRQHRKKIPFALGVTSPALIFFAYHASYSTVLIYAGLIGLAVTAVWNFIESRHLSCCSTGQARTVELKSTLTCPHCGFGKEETMPSDACLFFYECSQCKTKLKPKTGDCCVFCSYGTVKCPPMQLGTAHCCADETQPTPESPNA